MADGAWLNEGADGRYWEALRAGHLELPQCAGCGRWHWPAVWRCGDCGSWDHAWRAVPMAGAVYSWTRTWHPFAGAENLSLPFVTVVVRLDGAGGRRLTGLLLDGETDPRIGAPVAGAVGETSFNDIKIPTIHWRLAQGTP